MITSFFTSKKRKAADVKEKVASPATPATTSCSESSDEQQSNKKGKQQAVEQLGHDAAPSTDTAVQELLSCLDGSVDDDKNSWRKALNNHFSSNRFESLAKFVESQRKSATIYPLPEDVFSSLNLCPLDRVKVVIVGQDPYHGPGQGHGLCFSVRKGVQVPPSLKNIYKELKNDPQVDFPAGNLMPNHGYLERWARQGVLLLNAVLTVRRGEANSHKGKGWEDTTDQILRALARDRRESGRKGIVYLLWGKPAAKKIESVLGTKNKNQVIISTSHPSPLGATKTSFPFIGSRCFSRANKALKEMGHEPIDWNVDDIVTADV